eukprot:m.17641 g.17641  ORF g.17641 m.17641 type:complete len:576 (-) comp6072_c0_seq1:86-1813(-)
MESHEETGEENTNLKDVSGATEEVKNELRNPDPPKEFTSENFKIVINNVNRYASVKDIKKFLVNKGLDPVKIKRPYGNFAFVGFRNTEAREQALKVLNTNLKFKGQEISANYAKPAEDPLAEIRKRKLEESDGPAPKRHLLDQSIPAWKLLANKVTPMWEMPYEMQLKKKQQAQRQKLLKICRQFARPLPRWAEEGRKAHNGLYFPLDEIRPSPVIDGYRNKCEFTIGYSTDGTDKKLCVGHLLGCYKDGELEVIGTEKLKNIPQQTNMIRKEFETILEKSSLPVYDKVSRKGVWRYLLVRNTSSGEALAQLSGDFTDVEPQVKEKEITRIKVSLELAKINGLKLTSFLVQHNPSRSGVANDLDPAEVLIGEETITETMNGLQFRISPAAFFQVNTAGAAGMISLIKSLCAEILDKAILLDICCGTGTIGISLADAVNKVIGVDICVEAIQDAAFNANLNGLTNTTFMAGKAQDTIQRILDGLPADEASSIVGILDPPRDGLHKSVIHCIRRHEALKYLIYISCSLGGASQNFVDLCRNESKKFKGNPFILKKSVPLDLFPHTDHCENILIFERP